jgi:hypothetical protein
MERAASRPFSTTFSPLPERTTTVTGIDAHYTRCRALGHENGIAGGENPGSGLLPQLPQNLAVMPVLS